MTRSLTPFRRQLFPMPPREALLPQNELVDEEICPGYDSTKFYPANPGELLGDRYQILVKVGWGISSTVWLARDMMGHEEEPESVVTLKITNTNTNQTAVEGERQIEERIANADPSHRGLALFRPNVDSFEVSGPNGKHLCLAYEPMREPFWLFQRRFEDWRIPLPLVKTYILFFLVGLDYLHTGCKVIHTDLKLENIMVSFEDPAVLGDFLNSHLDQPVQCKIDSTGRHIYRRHNDFGPVRNIRRILPKIVDFGGSTQIDSEKERGIYPIQPDHYRAPEVILGCGWETSADIWNLGVLLWDIIQGRELFRQVHDAQGHYQAKAHLAEMIALLGHPPPELIARLQSMKYQWPEPVEEDGVTYDSAEQYFGGPFFDHTGKFLHEDLIPDRNLADTLPFLEEKERENFLSFAKMMLAWLPEERKTARELIEHPFLQRTKKPGN
ncbi:uncharacterized protein N7518_005505 [Penicillium psychrosexuale]|uniref:uncharacterized protein n=1 Tax=Penicillium psychrosexuale TaxID=1002107 RepID=UPI002544D4B8|nr:uncharacterized protein N7518_005505 [Penicillium psychrosexuale]KAJ5796965.1 hypothetical protein N7518_005505 [Penicillium psychrosexuale]